MRKQNLYHHGMLPVSVYVQLPDAVRWIFPEAFTRAIVGYDSRSLCVLSSLNMPCYQASYACDRLALQRCRGQ